jgi:hypothetical protein
MSKDEWELAALPREFFEVNYGREDIASLLERHSMPIPESNRRLFFHLRRVTFVT